MNVYTAGTFDIPHVGHVNFLSQCAKLGDVTVALNTDAFVERYKGQDPCFSFEERYAVISALRCVRQVFPQDSGSLGPQLERLKPDYLAIGTDWARKDYYAQIGVDQDWLDEHKITLVYIPYYKPTSTTALRRRIANHYCGGHVPCECKRASQHPGKFALPDAPPRRNPLLRKWDQ